MRDLRVKYRSTITTTATFRDPDHNLLDPEVVECHLNGEVLETTRSSLGVYTATWLADTPGQFKRVWVGRSDDNTIYSESKPLWINVAKSEVP